MDRYRGTRQIFIESFTIMRLAAMKGFLFRYACVIFGSSWQDASIFTPLGLCTEISSRRRSCQQWNVEDLRLWTRAIFTKIATTTIRCDAMVSNRLLLSSEMYDCATVERRLHSLKCYTGSHFSLDRARRTNSSDTAGTWQAYIKRLRLLYKSKFQFPS